MTSGHLLCTDGVSGDLWLGALVDAGVPLETLRSPIASLGIGPVELSAEPAAIAGVAATRVRVRVGDDAPRLPGWSDVEEVVGGAPIDGAVRSRALAVARRLAEAEATVHGTDIADVVFHELGNVDTVVDILGTVVGLAALGVDTLTCGPVTVGSGTVSTHHGRLPVPAPAVVELLHGFTIRAGDRDRELATPTGAALLAELATPVDGLPPLRLGGRGRGATGPADGPATSVLTLLLGPPGSRAGSRRPRCERRR